MGVGSFSLSDSRVEVVVCCTDCKAYKLLYSRKCYRQLHWIIAWHTVNHCLQFIKMTSLDFVCPRTVFCCWAVVEGYVLVVTCIIGLLSGHNTSSKLACKGIKLGQVLAAGMITATNMFPNIRMVFTVISIVLFSKEHFLSGCPGVNQPSVSSSGYCRFTQVTGGCMSGQAAPDGCQRTPLNFTTHL